MRNLASILVLVFAFSLTTTAQKKRKDKRPKLSVEQHTDLAIKKMTLALDLTEKQQKQIKPLLQAQAEKRKVAMEKRKEMRKNKTKLTADEMYKMQSERLDDQIAMKGKIKDILNKEQFEKFEKMARARKMKAKQKMKRMMAMKKKKAWKKKQIEDSDE